MQNSIGDVLDFVRDAGADVKFVRLAFCAGDGTPKNISIMPEELARAFDEGVRFDPSSIAGLGDVKQARLFPSADTLAVLPWRPQQGRVVRFYCDIRLPDGSLAPFDWRASLQRTLGAMGGIEFTVRAECDFYTFLKDENGAATTTPFDQGGYFDVFPSDLGENVRREICFHLQEMSILPVSSHHAAGPGQNTIELGEVNALACADNLLTFRTTVGAVAGQNGLAADFREVPFDGAVPSTVRLTIRCGDAEFEAQMSPSENPYAALEKVLRDELQKQISV